MDDYLSMVSLLACLHAGLPLLYMAVIAPIGFLVDTDETGNHYGFYSNGTLTAWVEYCSATLTIVNPLSIAAVGSDMIHILSTPSLLPLR